MWRTRLIPQRDVAPAPAAHDRQPHRGSRARLLRRWRAWIVGLLVAALGLTITNAATGVISSAGGVLWRKITGQQPVEISVSTAFAEFSAEPLAVTSGGGWVIPRPIELLSYPPRGDEDRGSSGVWDQWAVEQGGVPGSPTIVGVVIQGRTSSPVVLLGLRVRVLQRQEAPSGSTIMLSAGGPIIPRRFEADLDREPPRLTFQGDEERTDDRAMRFPYTVSATEPEFFLITASAEQYDCTWVAELHWSFQGRTGVTAIENNGEPFRTASKRNAPTYIAMDGRFIPAAR